MLKIKQLRSNLPIDTGLSAKGMLSYRKWLDESNDALIQNQRYKSIGSKKSSMQILAVNQLSTTGASIMRSSQVNNSQQLKIMPSNAADQKRAITNLDHYGGENTFPHTQVQSQLESPLFRT